MLYLAGQFAWFLLAALGLGCIMGWVAQSSRKARFWSPAWTWVAALWGIGAALAWFQLVNGRLASWIETALLFVAAYWLGCAIGALSGSMALAKPGPRSAQPAEAPQPAVNEPAVSESTKEQPVENELVKVPTMEAPAAGTAPAEPDTKPAPGRWRKPKG